MRFPTDVNASYDLVTGCNTNGMPGWGSRAVNHIVASRGYIVDSQNGNTVYYAETASQHAGYNGSYTQYTSQGTFWNYVAPNSSQVW